MPEPDKDRLVFTLHKLDQVERNQARGDPLRTLSEGLKVALEAVLLLASEPTDKGEVKGVIAEESLATPIGCGCADSLHGWVATNSRGLAPMYWAWRCPVHGDRTMVVATV